MPESNIITICGARDGVGGLLLSLQCAESVLQSGKQVRTYLCTDDVKFRPLQYLFQGKFNLEQLPESYGDNDKLAFSKELQKEIGVEEGGEFYYVVPDDLYRNPCAFNFHKYNTNPQTIKTTRLLNYRLKQEKIIYLALISSTNGYSYPWVNDLVKKLSQRLPDHTIYIPKINEWASKKIQNFDTTGLPKNVYVDTDPDFVESLKWLEKSCYTICLDNGVSHISYHLGQQRLLLDPHSNNGNFNWMFYARWRENLEDSISLSTPPDSVVQLVKTNLEIPQTSLLPKDIVVNSPVADWKRILNFKY